MTLTLTPEMEAVVERQFATGQFATREEVVRIALLHMQRQYDELKAALVKVARDVRRAEEVVPHIISTKPD